MFTPTDREKRTFVKRTREERQQRAKDRLEKEKLARNEQAATMLQRWWRLRRHQNEGWMWWDGLVQSDPNDTMRIVGLYCLLSRHRPNGPDNKRRLGVLCKVINISYYGLLADVQLMEKAERYLVIVIQQCLQSISENTYMTGPELSFLLQFLNPKNYRASSAETALALQARAKAVLEQTLLKHDLAQPVMCHVNQVVRLEDKAKRSKSGLPSEETKLLQGSKLWLTTVTRLTLFPTEVFDLPWATWHLIHLPLITRMVSSQVADLLRKWILPAGAMKWAPDDGDGILFFLANGVDLWQDETDSLVSLASTFVGRMQPYFSARQTPHHQKYHPVFKWSSGTGYTSDSTAVFHRVTEQLEWLWSRTFMDRAFTRILAFEPPHQQPTRTKPSAALKTRLLMRKTKQQQQQQQQLAACGQQADFAIDVQLLFSLYSRLASLFADQRSVILYRIAFTAQLMPQLWLVLNSFGPRGEMAIYLDAARKGAAELEKEPLIDVLKVFCEACSLVFLTVDETDIFSNETPFSPKDLIKLSEFLNAFYFALLQSSDEKGTLISFRAARRLLLQLHELDSQHTFCPLNHWLLVLDPSTKPSLLSLFHPTPSSNPFLERLRQGDPAPLRILQLMPHTISFETRLKIFRDWVALDRAAASGTRIVKVRRDHVLEDGFQGLTGMAPSAWKGAIRVRFVNELGMEEAGIDQGGPFKDFVSLLTTEVFKPSFALFTSTENNLFYPASKSRVHGTHHIKLFRFIGLMVGKAVYEGILLDVQFASFVLAKLLGRNVFLEGVKELDEDIWRNLTFIKHYDGCMEDLGLTFAVDEDEFGQRVTRELKYGGKHISVTNENKVEYVYLMADYKLNRQTKEQTQAFIEGFLSVISDGWIKIFSPPELQRVISGEDTDFGKLERKGKESNGQAYGDTSDTSDLRRHTEYQHGYFDQHPVIRVLWQIVEEFSSDEKRAFLKFVTSCPKPPLGGFDYLQPPFTIRMVSTDEGVVGGQGRSFADEFNVFVKHRFALDDRRDT
ncbi:Ubiquitin-protein ligase E3B [Apophysomyces sp. BC1034]|nr:Ubiquitin-protein ligase E3B [Apophysomyces sp. BC1034]